MTDDWKSIARRLGAAEPRTGNAREGKPSLLSNQAHLGRIDKGPRGLAAAVLRLSHGQHPDIIRLSPRLLFSPVTEAGNCRGPNDARKSLPDGKVDQSIR